MKRENQKQREGERQNNAAQTHPFVRPSVHPSIRPSIQPSIRLLSFSVQCFSNDAEIHECPYVIATQEEALDRAQNRSIPGNIVKVEHLTFCECGAVDTTQQLIEGSVKETHEGLCFSFFFTAKYRFRCIKNILRILRSVEL